MIAEKRVLAVIPARGGSKGLPGKNLLQLGGRPLVAWTIEAASRARYIDRVVVSSDDEEILREARQWGCEEPMARPRELATDSARNIDVVMDLLNRLPGYDIVALLQPTSPLRDSRHIEEALEAMDAANSGSCISVVRASKSPYWSYSMNGEGRLAPLIDSSTAQRRRQLQPVSYYPNGAIYLATVMQLKETGSFLHPETLGYPMSKEDSIDIDDHFDFRMAELAIALRRNGEGRPS